MGRRRGAITRWYAWRSDHERPGRLLPQLGRLRLDAGRSGSAHIRVVPATVHQPGAPWQSRGQNIARSIRAAAGTDTFARRSHTLGSGIVGFDVDAIYWTNAAEVRRHLERLGCTIVRYQTEASSAASRAVARLVPSFAGQLAIVGVAGAQG
jgi:hypothetical protein